MSIFHVVLYQPEIPPNTGNIIRLCANTGIALHLIEPYGFKWNDAKLRRAGMDYNDLACVQHYASWDIFLKTTTPKRLVALSTKATNHLYETDLLLGDYFVFGPESRGLPDTVRATAAVCLRIPMRPDSRSLNLSNSVAITVYEALRQRGFDGLL